MEAAAAQGTISPVTPLTPLDAAGLVAYRNRFDAPTQRQAAAWIRDKLVKPVATGRRGDIAWYRFSAGWIPKVCELFRHPDGSWHADCTCGRLTGCVHAFAGVLWLQQAAPAASRTFADIWEPELRSALKRPLTMADRQTLNCLADLFARLQRAGGELTGSAYIEAGFPTPEAERERYSVAFRGWWEDRPPADPWELWQYLAADLEASGRPLPEVLRPKTDTGSIRAAIGRKLLAAQIEHWRLRLQDHRRFQPAPPQPATTWRTKLAGLRLRLTPDGWRLEARPDARNFKSVNQPLLRQLARAAPEDLFHLSPPETALALLLLAGEPGHLWSAAQEPSPLFISGALRLAAARDAIRGPTGQPWQVEAEPLRWRAVLAPGGGPVPFELANTQGEAVPASLATLVPEPYYVDGDRIFRGPPPLPEASVPRPVLADARVAGALERLGVILPAEIGGRIRRAATEARFEIWIGNSYAGLRQIWARLFASASDPACEQTWTGEGWKWTVRPSDRIEAVDFDLARPEKAAELLREIAPWWDGPEQAWRGPLPPDFAERFVAWTQRLPPGAKLAASPEFAGLAEPPAKARYRLRAKAAGGVDWFDVDVKLEADDLTFTPAELELLAAARGAFVDLPNRGWRRLQVENQAETESALGKMGLASAPGVPARLHVLHLADPDLKAVLPAPLAEAAARRVAALRNIDPPPPPKHFAGRLRPYQEEGFHFLAFLAENQLGGVLADDMGLGKTIQALAWLLWLRARLPARRRFRALVVCPKSVAFNWAREAAVFAPGLPAAAINSPECRKILAAGGITIANYTQLRLQRAELGKTHWDAVILDEGQFIKNPASATAKAACALRARQRLVLTGTPIENRLLDLWSLFAFAQPGLLGDQAGFARRYPDSSPDARALLSRRIRHFMLRRSKAEVAADLPPRTEEDLLVPLEGRQAELYQAELKAARQAVLGIASDEQFRRQRFHILSSLLRLRQICCDPRLAGDAGDAPSAKLEALLDTLEPLVAEGHKVLVFSQFTRMLALIQSELETRRIGHLLLTGETEDRESLVRRFQEDRAASVFLISLKAGGTGLNLTAASYVVLYDPWWNPAVEAQAIDRTHRIGQTARVIAYRLIARDTIEEKIRALQRTKAELAASVVQEESLASVMDLETLRALLA
ncbi:MAG TPA: DEAD/DEAH box helicase [Opitutaceae bacterium]|jgi:superfamily II DNA or RNA helicase|nr:DEAD/DEAH box helicase [Opitutaceae bacterium]